ncbi:MAG: hypothetical protein RR515_03845 [Clostridium sp.]
MNKSKRALIISAVLIVIGIIGAIPTGIIGIPNLINQVGNNINTQYGKLKDIALLTEDIENITLYGVNDRYSIDIRQSADNKLHIKTGGESINDVVTTRSYNKETKSLVARLDSKRKFFYTINMNNGLATMVSDFILTVNPGISRIVVEVPKAVNINIKNVRYGNVKIEDNKVLKDNLIIEDSILDLNIPDKNTLKNQKIINSEIQNEYQY